MYCFKEEIRKLLYHKILLVFWVVCMVFNLVLILLSSGPSRQLDIISQDYKPQMGEEILKHIDGSGLGTWYYDERYKESDVLVTMMHDKYQKLDLALENLVNNQADLSTYAEELTVQVHEALFGYLTKALMIEGILIFTFLVLDAFYIEYHDKALYTVYCSRRGRRIVFDKMFAAFVLGLIGLVILCVLSYLVFFKVWNFEKIWDANVASSFNYILDSDEPIFRKPFITWTSFTVKQYFVATVIMMAGIWIAWWMLSTAIVLVNRKMSIAIGILASAFILPFFGLILFTEIPELYFLTTLSITADVYYSHVWFTDMGYHSIVPWQETMSVIIHLGLGALCIIGAYYMFRRKDIC